jgi:hypothetical protein
MNERIFLIALIALAVLASIPQIPLDAQIWGALLVIVGLVAGVTASYEDMTQRLLVYVIAAVLPTIANSLDAIWVVGHWVNMLLDNFAIGLQGMALGLFAMALAARLRPSAATVAQT